jgi:DNA-binding PadR family transcriptional regulator
MNSAEMLKGHLDGLLLAVLADGPLHGYGVVERLRARGHAADTIDKVAYANVERVVRTALSR